MSRLKVSCIILGLFLLLGINKTEAGLFGKKQDVSSKTVEQAIEKVYPSLVRIEVVALQASGGRLQRIQASGSGAVISKEGHIVTNHHVAGKAHALICRMPDGEEIEATLIGTDPMTDIAVIKLNLESRKEQKPLHVASFGDSETVQVGDSVMALGSPAGLSQSVTLGIVSNIAMISPGQMNNSFKLDGESVGKLVRWIGHDAVIFGGNSGGPLVNTKGEIIGINEVGIGSLGGAIPGNLAKDITWQLIKNGEVKRSWTGLECQPRTKSSAQESGILVAGVIQDSPAMKAGVLPGDILFEFNGIQIDAEIPEDMPIYNRIELGTPIGAKITLKAFRGEEMKSFEFKTIARESARGEDNEFRSWGMTARNFTIMSALEFKRENKDGVQVHSTRSGGPAQESKPSLNSGDVILEIDGKPVKNVDDLIKITSKILKDKEERVPVVVRFHRHTKDMLTVVKIGKDQKSDKPILSRKPWLPVETQVLTRDMSRALGLKGKSGVRVVRIHKGRNADKAGMKVGDILLRLDGDEIEASQPEDQGVLNTMIRQYKIGAEVDFSIVRDGKKSKLTVKLEEPIKPVSDLKRYEDEFFEVTVREMNFKDKSDRKLDDGLQGVLIERVERAGWAALGGLRAGDILSSVNNEKVGHPDDVEKALKLALKEKHKSIVFFIRRGIHTVFLEAEPSYDINTL